MLVGGEGKSIEGGVGVFILFVADVPSSVKVVVTGGFGVELAGGLVVAF